MWYLRTVFGIQLGCAGVRSPGPVSRCIGDAAVDRLELLIELQLPPNVAQNVDADFGHGTFRRVTRTRSTSSMWNASSSVSRFSQVMRELCATD